ncbi:hypothetical protein F4809DRAFT_341918 [Biscogniauxia mediterranea]|nr:hypothetical protein F4809DRAFT_341918 [Biscogniauxia mediterranea]
MGTQNTYLAYKRDTKHLLYWIIHASNSIKKSLVASGHEATPELNNTGQTTVAGLVSMSKLIAQHMKNPVPSLIYRLFQSVIEARTITYGIFQQAIANQPDPEVEKSNASHKHFIDALTEAFDALGGQSWLSGQIPGNQKPDSDDDINVIFTNKFSTLNINQPEEDGEGDGTSDEEETTQTSKPTTVPRQRQQKSSGKGKKGKKGKSKKKQKAATPKQPCLDQVPLESYRIIEDGDGIVTDYLMAVYALASEWSDLRRYLLKLWQEVAYEGLNSAVAAAVSHLAIEMVKQTESSIFIEFPNHESYETVMQTITRGNIDKAQGMFTISMFITGPDSSGAKKVRETNVDIKEQLMIHTYRALLDFVEDFQKTRSGKPTKRMLAEIRDWDPNLDLQQASEDQRLKWRRSYTINWLYDLVNVYSSIVVQRNTLKGQNHAYEKVDWSSHGPWGEHRRLFGLNEFAGVITSLAMQLPGTNVRERILPHLVFQLQCIVDSLAVSRGWSLSGFQGHVLLPPAKEFRPRRDVDLFLEREGKRDFKGFLQGVQVLQQLFERDGALQGNPNRHKQHFEFLKEAQEDFINWLGESKYMYGLKTIPPSRFSHINANGLWEYSPFLCGAGLMEGLELAYLLGMMIWDRIPEPMLLIHLHNMLVQKGFISQPVGLFRSLQDLFPDAWFADGKAPTGDFSRALLARIEETSSRRAVFHRRSLARTAMRTSLDIHGVLNPAANRFFKTKSYLILYRQADWDFARIPEEDIPIASMLGTLRLAQMKHVVDPLTGQKRMPDTELVRRARAQGMRDEDMVKLSSSESLLTREKGDSGRLPRQFLDVVPEGYSTGWISELDKKMGRWKHPDEASNNVDISGCALLELLKWDFFQDICGESHPLSSLNYIWVAVRCMALFMMFEDELKRLRNPLYVEAYETNSQLKGEKRLGLAMLAFLEQDEECLQVMARLFQEPRIGFMHHIYWDDLGSALDTFSARQASRKDEMLDACNVM